MNKSESSSIEKRVSEKLKEYFPQKPNFVVGVSGGAVSMALLYILKKLDIHALVVHINYEMRGEESNKDQELVEQMSFEWGFECCSVRLNSKEISSGNFQNWAREQRYNIFNGFLTEIEADGIAVAHHKNDQVETIIQKLLRGSSPEAWKGMDDWNNEIFRPLLEFNKAEILKYCKENSIPFRTDSSNIDSKYSRNFLRNEFSQKMDKLFKGWQENVMKLQEYGSLNKKMLDLLAKDYFDDEKLFIQPIKELDVILAQSLIKKFIEQFHIQISKGVLEQAYNLLSSQVGSELILSESVKLVRERESIIKVTGVVEFEEFQVSETEVLNGVSNNELVINISKSIESELYLDADRIKFPLLVRRWKAGDSIQPLGMKGTQKVSDHLTNRKVPAAIREKSLVLCDSDGTIYAIIFEGNTTNRGTISELSKATDSTKRYLSITSKK